MSARILAVDDSTLMRVVYAQLLGDAGYSVGVARDGRDGLVKLAESRPDLVLLDIDMPRMDGWEFLAEMRKHRDFEDIPVVVVSAMREPDQTERDSALSYDAYLTKKVAGDELLLLVSAALEKREAAQAVGA